ncbi:MAG: hypothetical protein ACK50J_16000 [Planctomyces sp.]
MTADTCSCQPRRHRHFVAIFSLVILQLILHFLNQSTHGEEKSPLKAVNSRTATVPKKNFELEIDVLVQPQPAYRINAQKWGRVLQELGYIVRFREGRVGERTRVEDVDRQNTRMTQIVGIMEQNSDIVIRDRKFQLTDGEAFRQFAEEIAQYGASGPPEKDPRWGLSETQFADVVKLLTPAAGPMVSLQSPQETVKSISLPAVFQIEWTPKAMEQIRLLKSTPKIEGDLTVISRGTALAIALAQSGLGFRVLRGSGEGQYVIEVDAGNESSNLWPTGWKTRELPNVAVPGLYKAIPVEAEDFQLPALITVIGEKLKIPHFYSMNSLYVAGITPADLKYTRKPDRISPWRLMELIGDRFHIGMDIRADESGKCFLWVTSEEEHQAFRRRFAHIIPGREKP